MACLLYKKICTASSSFDMYSVLSIYFCKSFCVWLCSGQTLAELTKSIQLRGNGGEVLLGLPEFQFVVCPVSVPLVVMLFVIDCIALAKTCAVAPCQQHRLLFWVEVLDCFVSRIKITFSVRVCEGNHVYGPLRQTWCLNTLVTTQCALRVTPFDKQFLLQLLCSNHKRPREFQQFLCSINHAKTTFDLLSFCCCFCFAFHTCLFFFLPRQIMFRIPWVSYVASRRIVNVPSAVVLATPGRKVSSCAVSPVVQFPKHNILFHFKIIYFHTRPGCWWTRKTHEIFFHMKYAST